MARLILFVGLIALGLVAWAALGSKPAEIEADLTARSASALHAAGEGWAKVVLDGRNAILAGAAPDGEAQARAVSLLENIGGLRWVENRSSIEPPLSPFVWTATREGDRLFLDGAVPSADAKAALAARARRLFGEAVEDRSRVARGAPARGWLDAAQLALAQLAKLEDGRAELNDTTLKLDGQARDTTTSRLVTRALRDELPDGYEPQWEVKAPAPPMPALATPSTGGGSSEAAAALEADRVAARRLEAERCQTLFNDILSASRIEFPANSSVLDAGASYQLDTLARAVTMCPEAEIEIGGHTDSSGDAARNRALSQSRAEAVMDYLVKAGIPAGRLKARGYGSSVPIASEDTAEGRARNRRIEFKILEAE